MNTPQYRILEAVTPDEEDIDRLTYGEYGDQVSPTAMIKLEDGPFSGIIYSYGRVSGQEEENGEFRLSFTYELIDGEVKEESLQQFETQLGDVLVDMMTSKETNAS